MKITIHSLILIITICFLIVINPIYTLEPKDIDAEEEDEDKGVKPPTFSLESGYYAAEDKKQLEISSEGTIYYTLDSTDPKTSETTQIYSKPIKLYDRSPEDDVYAQYKHEEDSPYSITLKYKFTPSNFPVDKITVIKAVSQNDQGEFSEIATKVYIVMDSDSLKQYSDIPLLSIVTDPANLFDKDIGIYVCGQQYIDWKNSADYNPNKDEFDQSNKANFYMSGEKWERESTLTFFENGKLAFSQNMGIRIKGKTTSGLTAKGFNVFARKKYQGGKGKLAYPLFDDNVSHNDGKKIEKYDSFGIRNYQFPQRLRENVITQAIRNLDSIATYENKRANLFIDGEYWGLSDLVEKDSKYYFLTNFGIPEGNHVMIKNGLPEEGEEADTRVKWAEIQNFCKSNDLSDSDNYKKVAEQIDIDSIIAHYAIGLYIGVNDWPNFNYFVFKNNGEPIEENPYTDGKWRFGSYDFDNSAGVNSKSTGKDYAFDYFTSIDSNKGHYPTSIFYALLKNNEFKQQFAKFFESLATDIFEPTKMTKILDENQEKYGYFLALADWRWLDMPDPAGDMDSKRYVKIKMANSQKTDFDLFREFFQKRPEYALKQMKSYLGIE